MKSILRFKKPLGTGELIGRLWTLCRGRIRRILLDDPDPVGVLAYACAA